MTTTPATVDSDPPHGILLEVVNSWMDAWNEADAERRRELVSRSFVAHGRYADPFLAVEGTEAIADSLGQLRELFPGHFVRRKSGVEAHFGRIRYAWELLDPLGSVVTDGVDVAELAQDGRFQHLVGWVGQVVAVDLERGPRSSS